MRPGMGVIIKPTFLCDAACIYCEVHKYSKYFKRMDESIFTLMNEKIEEFFEKKGYKNSQVTYYWLGGEPLMAGDDFYKKIYEITADVVNKKSQKITHAIQTNLISLGYKKFFYLKKLLKDFSKQKTNSYLLSTSVDPVSNKRVLKNKKNYLKEFLKAIFKVKEEKASYWAVYTVNEDSIGNEEKIYYFFKNLGFEGFNINAVCDYEGFFKNDVGFTPFDYGKFLCKMWDIWEEDNFSLNIVPFYSWKILKESGSQRELRCFNDGKCNKSLCALAPNGDLFTCDRAMQAKQAPLGNIKKNSLEDMFKKKYHQKRISYLKQNDCKDCRWWEYCKGSCPYESKGEYEGRFEKSYWCESFKMLFEYIEKK